MNTQEELMEMTVAQLRKYAKEQGIGLQTNMPKATIIETILSNQPERDEAASIVSKASRPIRQALIISDNSDDIPVMTVHDSTPKAPAAPPKATVEKPSTDTSKSNKPAFSLKGARAWHNPRPFVPQQSTSSSKFVPPGAQTIKTAYGAEDGIARPAPTFSRFGPDAGSLSSTPTQRVYRPAPISSNLGTRLGKQESTLPDPSPTYSAPVYSSESGHSSYIRKNEGNLSIPDMLAAGDIEDGAGVLDITSEGHGFLHVNNCLPGGDDIYVSNAQIRRFLLQDGDYVEGKVRPQQNMDRSRAMLYITSVNGQEIDDRKIPADFNSLTAQYPVKRIKLANREHPHHFLRMIELFTPIGFGQRALIEIPANFDAVNFIKQIDTSITDRHEDLTSIIVLAGEKPEEVPELKEQVNSDVYYATFDTPVKNTIRVGEMAAERAKRLAEAGKDVLIIIKDIVALSRAYLASAGIQETSYSALQPLKQLLGTARSFKDGGSVTIVSFIKVTNSKTAKKVFDEVFPLLNSYILLDSNLYEKGFNLPFNLEKSFTLRSETLLTEGENELMQKLLPIISTKNNEEALSFVLSLMDKTDTNRELISRFDNLLHQ